MNKFRSIIIEDEPLAQAKLKRFLKDAEKFDLLESFFTVANAQEFLEENSVDVIFLDINVGEENGMNLLTRELIGNAKVIITTAHEKYALQAYDLDVVDYLLKPFSESRFVQSLGKAENAIDKVSTTAIFVKSEHRKIRLNFDDILFFEGMRDYVRIHLKDRKIMTLEKMKHFESILPQKDFYRIHKSYIVRIDAIEEIEKSMVKIGSNLLPVAESKRNDFNLKLNVN